MVNILVYSGPEVLPSALKNTLTLLARLLIPNYTVQPVGVHVLQNQPWTSNCSVLVLPQLRSGHTISANLGPILNGFVEGGGQVLCLNSSAKVVKGMGIFGEVSNEFRFTDRATGASLAPVFLQEAKEKDQTTRRIRSEGSEEIVEEIVEGGMPEFDIAGIKNPAQILAKSIEQDGEHIAAFQCQIGNGFVSFWAPNLENLSLGSSDNSDKSHLILLRFCLQRIGLKTPTPSGRTSRPLPQFLLSSPDKSELVQAVVDSLGLTSLPFVFKDESDTFQFHSYEEDAEPDIKHVIICPGGTVPSHGDTPLFNLEMYFNHLGAARTREGCRDAPGFGETVFYSHVVTSTQTMLDKNLRLLSQLPPTIPILSLASHQVAGRGRGSNSWISPEGCLTFSLLIPRVPLSPHSPHANSTSALIASYIPPSKLVFIQYLFALAVAEACRTDFILGSKLGDSVRIKWPNDIYVLRSGSAEKVKIGGILVNTAFAPGGKEADIVIGCGLNVFCRAPLISLVRLGYPTLSSPHSDAVCPPILPNLSMELTLTTILSKFEKMWDRFLASGGDFEPFLNLYLERWLHSDQLVKLTTVSPPKL
ncbi:class II aaRS and biotin synthetase [Gymnopus androsaceus JB14]|uniref:Class II aaRS and biotin synthetase n=1 Tax=Gymnopus androsaceus JB14 TaxID=1447944 RepID=A0A6A4H8P8_9AGAR|nr:class II aaRS and biotin synthetase [Gymnopus androsaceus JB14]